MGRGGGSGICAECGRGRQHLGEGALDRQPARSTIVGVAGERAILERRTPRFGRTPYPDGRTHWLIECNGQTYPYLSIPRIFLSRCQVEESCFGTLAAS